MRRIKLTYLLLLSLAISITSVHYTHASNDVKTDIDTISGIQRTIFSTAYGNVVVLLPDEMKAGDLISGTIMVNAADSGSKDVDRLYKYTVDINNEISPVGQNSVIKFSLPKSSTGGVTYMVLRNEKGNEVSRNYITYQNYVVNFNAATAPSPWEFQTPSLGRSGRFSLIKGPFDGNFGTTSMLIGNSSVIKIAESPRQMVFKNPDNAQGETELLLMERGIEVRRKYQNMQVVKFDESLDDSDENPVTASNKTVPQGDIPDSVTEETKPVSGVTQVEPETPVINTKAGFIEEKELHVADKVADKTDSTVDTQAVLSKDTKDNETKDLTLTQTATAEKKGDDIEVNAVNQKSSADKVTDTVSASATSEITESQPETTGGSNYTVQIASYKNEKDALELVSKLESKGYDARVIRAQIPNKGLWYRIRIGAFQTEILANDYGMKLTREEPLVKSMFVTRSN